MNPLKQKGCQACGAALPYADSDAKDPTKAQARATLRGLRSPESPTDGLTPAELEAMKGELPPEVTVAVREGTMPSFVAPSSAVIDKHRDSITTTIVGHAVPKVGQAAPDSIAPSTPKDSPRAPRPQDFALTPVDLNRPGFAGRTLLGHQVPKPAHQSASGGQTSQTLPSMQAVVPDSGSTPISSGPRSSPSVRSFGGSSPSGRAASPELGSSPEQDPPGDVPEHTPFLAFEEGPADSPALNSSSRSTPPTPRSYRFSDDPTTTVVTPPPISSQGYFGAVSPVSKAIPVRTGSPESVRAANVRLGRRVLVIASVLLLGLSLFALLWTPPEPPTARLIGVGEQTMLEVACNTCDDNSSITIGGQKGAFTAHRASVPMPRPLNLGYNDIEILIERTGIGRNERMQLQFPIDYRLAWDLSRLDQIPPTLGINVEAALGVTVSLDGQPVSLADNRGFHPVAIAADLMGPSVSEQWLEKSVPVAISGGRGSTPPDHFTLKIPIVPLAVDTPWDGFQTSDETTVVSGRSTPNTRISVAGNPTTTNAEGYFELALQTVPGLNTFTIAAEAPGHAPRFVNVSLTKVPSAGKAALEYQGTALNRFDELTKRLQTSDTGVRVALPGKVQESKVQGSTTVLLVGVAAGCPNRACVVRVVYPTRLALKEGERVAVFGVATLASAGPTPQSALPENSRPPALALSASAPGFRGSWTRLTRGVGEPHPGQL